MSEPADLFTAKPINSAQRLDGPSSYVLRQARRSRQGEEDLALLDLTTTLYVGNLSFFTTEEQIHELFSKIAKVKKIIMGLDRYQKTPCGFCFVEYYEHDDAVACLKYLHKTKLDERIISIDLDPGFKDGRQFGRGSSGGQVRDEFRQDYDSGRGGFGKRWGDDERDAGDDY